MREDLAALEHDQWAHGTKHMLEVLAPVLELGFAIGPRFHPDVVRAEKSLERWWRQINTPYADLTEKEKSSDREWADKVLEITGKEGGPKE
ncbi:MAG: hypothetical protein CL902_01030 [Dehalococcoidia bacterium]|nr:hypothetical protein [Dehalococcoidia bacterium]